MRKLLAGITVAIMTTAMMSHAQSPQGIPFGENESAGRWFVELSNPPGVEGTSSAVLDREEADFHSAARRGGVRYSNSRRLKNLWNGVIVTATARDVTSLRSIPGVQSVYPVMKVSLGPVERQPGNDLDLVTALQQTGTNVAQSELGLSGRGIRVAVIDSGIDYDHPALGGCFGRQCRVESGFDFVGDEFDANNPAPIIKPDMDPDDCEGHGTHVAGIIGADGGAGGIKGVAPGVTFLAYRVFGCVGSTTSEVLIEAMERALRDGADIVNISSGAALQWPQYPTAKAADRLVRHGIVVVASTGNEGTFGLYAASAPGVAKNVIAVASFENTYANLSAFSLSPDETSIGYIPASGAPAPPTDGAFPMTRTGTGAATADACAPLPQDSLSGTVVLIRRGTCSFYQKAFNAQAAGAAGVVIYNDVAGFVTPTVVATPAITIPVVWVSAARGAFVDGRLDEGEVTMTWTNEVASEPNPSANLVSSFSSFGVAPDLSFKPDIGAPGSPIRSTLPLEMGGYGSLSGTSMASAHVAGAVALLLEARPGSTPEVVQQRLQNSAQPHLFSLAPSAGFLDIVHRQGAGMLQIDDAILSDAIVSPSSLALGEIEAGSATRWLRLSQAKPLEQIGRGFRRRHNRREENDAPVTYTLGHEPALSTGANTLIPQFLASFATVSFSSRRVSIGGRRHESDDDVLVGVTITPPPQAEGARLFGGYITFTPNDGGTVLRVPYVGYNGDYQAIQALTPTVAGLPWLAKLTPTGLLSEPGGAQYTMAGGDVPVLLVHLAHPVANLKVEVIDVVTGQSWNLAEDDDFFGRNSGETEIFVIPWNGTTFKRRGGQTRTVPNGTYRIDLSILKALGDPRNPEHFERWSSPNIAIARPAAVAAD